MKAILLLGVAFVAVTGRAVEYKPLKVEAKRETRADVTEVVLLDSKVVDSKEGTVLKRHLHVTLGLTTVASACESATAVKYISGQSSLDNALNPSDNYYAVSTKWRPGCATGSFGKPEYVKFPLKFFLAQSFGDDPEPLKFDGAWAIHHYNFDAGMMGGFNRWLLYKLDYTNPENVKFEKVKLYSYVQGTVKE